MIQSRRKILINSLAPDVFHFKVDTTKTGTTAANEFALPLHSTSTINATVDWGDGTINTVTSHTDPNATHTYTSSGVYEIKISGTNNGWIFAGGGDCQKMMEIYQWGTFDFSKDSVFNGCTNLLVSATDAPIISTNSFNYTFRDCSSMTTLSMVGWDFSTIQYMSTSFRGCSELESIPGIGDLDMSSVFNTNWLFYLCEKLNNLDLSNWTTVQFTNPSNMFRNTTALDDINITGWDLSGASNLISMFKNSGANPIGIENLVLHASANMTNMFWNADNFDRNLANWDVTGNKTFTNFMNSATGLSTANYDALLVGWEAQAPNTGKSINFGGSQYTLGGLAETARNSLTSTYSWTIVDGGGV